MGNFWSEFASWLHCRISNELKNYPGWNPPEFSFVEQQHTLNFSSVSERSTLVKEVLTLSIKSHFLCILKIRNRAIRKENGPKVADQAFQTWGPKSNTCSPIKRPEFLETGNSVLIAAAVQWYRRRSHSFRFQSLNILVAAQEAQLC